MAFLKKIKNAAVFSISMAFAGAAGAVSNDNIAAPAMDVLTASQSVSQVHPANRLIEKVSADMLDALKRDQHKLKNNPDHIYNILDAHLLDHIDFDTVALYVLGKYRPHTSEDQRERFTKAFSNVVIDLYARSLSLFDNEKINVSPRSYVSRNGDRATVRTQIEQDSGNDITVDYKLFLNKNNEWKIYDVAIEGISIVQTYRNQVMYSARQHGIEGMIRELENTPANRAAQQREAQKTASFTQKATPLGLKL